MDNFCLISINNFVNVGLSTNFNKIVLFGKTANFLLPFLEFFIIFFWNVCTFSKFGYDFYYVIIF